MVRHRIRWPGGFIVAFMLVSCHREPPARVQRERGTWIELDVAGAPSWTWSTMTLNVDQSHLLVIDPLSLEGSILNVETGTWEAVGDRGRPTDWRPQAPEQIDLELREGTSTTVLAPHCDSHPLAVLALVGHRVVVWIPGSVGDGRGAIYDLSTHAWSVMTREGAPTRFAIESSRVFVVSDRLVVWPTGGTSTADRARGAPGAAYDPRSDAWGSIPPPLDGVGEAMCVAGGRIVAWGGSTELEVPGQGAIRLGLHRGASYSFDKNAWTPLPASDQLSPREGALGVCSKDRFYVWGGYGLDRAWELVSETPRSSRSIVKEWPSNRGPRTDGAILDLAAGHWQAVPAPPGVDELSRDPVAVTSGEDLFVLARTSGASFRPGRGWQALPPDPAPGLYAGGCGHCLLAATKTGARLVARCTSESFDIYDIAGASWSRTAPAPAGTKIVVWDWQHEMIALGCKIDGPRLAQANNVNVTAEAQTAPRTQPAQTGTPAPSPGPRRLPRDSGQAISPDSTHLPYSDPPPPPPPAPPPACPMRVAVYAVE